MRESISIQIGVHAPPLASLALIRPSNWQFWNPNENEVTPLAFDCEV